MIIYHYQHKLSSSYQTSNDLDIIITDQATCLGVTLTLLSLLAFSLEERSQIMKNLTFIICYHLQMGLIRAVLYVLAQTCGAFLGAGILWTFTLNEV